MIVIFAFASGTMALAAQAPQSGTRVIPPAVHSASVVPEIAEQSQMRVCPAPAHFGSDATRVIDVVYYSAGNTCGLPPFYGFAFAAPVKR